MIKNQKKSNSILSIVLMVFVVITAIALVGTIFDIDNKPSSTTQKPIVDDNNSEVLRTDHETVIYCYNKNFEWFMMNETWYAYLIDETGDNEPLIIQGIYMGDYSVMNQFNIPAGYTHILFGSIFDDTYYSSIDDFYPETCTELMPIVENENKFYFPEFDMWFELSVIKPLIAW